MQRHWSGRPRRRAAISWAVRWERHWQDDSAEVLSECTAAMGRLQWMALPGACSSASGSPPMISRNAEAMLVPTQSDKTPQLAICPCQLRFRHQEYAFSAPSSVSLSTAWPK